MVMKLCQVVEVMSDEGIGISVDHKFYVGTPLIPESFHLGGYPALDVGEIIGADVHDAFQLNEHLSLRLKKDLDLD
jgi:hypothetical protein